MSKEGGSKEGGARHGVLAVTQGFPGGIHVHILSEEEGVFFKAVVRVSLCVKKTFGIGM